VAEKLVCEVHGGRGESRSNLGVEPEETTSIRRSRGRRGALVLASGAVV